MWFVYKIHKDVEPGGVYELSFTSVKDVPKLAKDRENLKYVKGITLGNGKMMFVSDIPPWQKKK